MRRDKIFRDTKSWYLGHSEYVSKKLIEFTVQHAGKEILEIGCATGEYCKILNELGFNCLGIDINPDYIKEAKKRGIEAYVMDAGHLKFPDNSFDTVIIFEVLEHVKDPHQVIEEAKRVARKNILITVPNCSELDQLKKLGLTYEHMLEIDHINFFTKDELKELLSSHFEKFRVEKREPIPICAIGLPTWLRYPILGLYKLKIIRPTIYFRLYAIAEVR